MSIFRMKDFKERIRQGLSRTTLCELELKIISLLSAPCIYTGGLSGDGCYDSIVDIVISYFPCFVNKIFFEKRFQGKWIYDSIVLRRSQQGRL